MFSKAWVVVTAFALAACAGIQPAPQSAGVSKERLDAITARMKADAQSGKIPGAVMVVARNGQTAYFEAVGTKDPKSGAPMPKDAIFRIYSMTKPIVTIAAMILVEEGKLQVGDPVSRYLPELKGMKVGVGLLDAAGKPVLELVNAQREMTVQDLLRHTSGLTYGFFGKSLVKDRYREAHVDTGVAHAEYLGVVSKLPLHYQPGTTWDYSISTDVLVYVIERVSGKPLDQFLQERVFKPLGMKDTGFYVEPAKASRLAEGFEADPLIKAADDWHTRKQPAKRFSGGAGITSTAADYQRFAQMLVNGGELDGVRIVSRKTVEYMDSDHLGAIRGPLYLPGAGYTFGLGGAVRLGDGMATTPGSAGEFNWGGYGGTYFWIDPKEKLVAVLMMQSPSQRTYYRTLFRDMVYGALQ